MSWDSYIDNLIAQSKDSYGVAHVDRACIIGLDGGAFWTTSSHPNALQVRLFVVQIHMNCLKCSKRDTCYDWSKYVRYFIKYARAFHHLRRSQV